MLPILCAKCRNSSTGCLGATVVDRKGASDYGSSFLTSFIKSLGFTRILVRSDNERSLLSLIERVTNNLTGVELVLMTSPEGDHAANGLPEVGVREIKAQTRILKSQPEQRLGNRIDEKDPLMSWIPRHAANCVSRYRLMDDGRTSDQRRCGQTWKRPVVEFGESVHFRPVGETNALRGGDQRMLRGVYVGHHERSGAAIFLTPDGVKRETRIARMLEHERWDRVFSATCIGVPWQLRPDQRNLARPVVPVAEADHGVAPVIVMPAVPKTDRGRYVTKRDLVKYGYTDECHACTQLASGMHNAKVPHDDRCRNRIGELMADDDNQKQVEPVSPRTVPEVEILCPEAGEEMDVGEPTVRVAGWKNNQFPQFEWVDHQAKEPELAQVQEHMKRTQMIVKRNVSDSQRAEARRGKARTWKNWQRRLKNNILMPMLRSLPTRHGGWRTLSGMRQTQRPNK